MTALGLFPAEWYDRPDMPPAYWVAGRGWVRVMQDA